MGRPLPWTPSDFLYLRFGIRYRRRWFDTLWCRVRFKCNWGLSLFTGRCAGGQDITRDPRRIRTFLLSFVLSDRDLRAWTNKRLRHTLHYRPLWRSPGSRFVNRN